MSTIKETVWDGTRFLELDAGTVDGKNAIEFEVSDPKIQIHINKAHAPADAQKNSDITKSEIEAKLTGDISTHHHALTDSAIENAKAHIADSTIHVLSSDKTRWEDKFTKAEINTKFNVLDANNNWRPPVDTFASIKTIYPNPVDGWIVSAKDTKYTYRYDGLKWIPISANAIQNATGSTSGLMSNQDKTKLDGVANGANNYVHPATHPASAIVQDANNRFMTDSERTKLSGISAGANAYTHPATHPPGIIVQDANNRFMTDIERNKLANIEANANAYVHPTGEGSNHIPAGGSIGQVLKNTASGTATWQEDKDTITTINGKTGNIVKADIVALGIPGQDTVYTHPATHPASLIVQDANNRFMTDVERTKLTGIATNANNYVHPVTHPASVIMQDENNRFMTDAERVKLSGITDGANSYTHPATHPPSIIAQDASNRFMTDAEKTKLSGIATGANNYIHPATDGNLHVPATGTTNSGKVLKAGSTAGSLSWGTLTAADVGAAPMSELTNVDNKIGILPALQTTAKTDVVSAINENVGKITALEDKINTPSYSATVDATAPIISLPSTVVKGKLEGSIKGNTLYQAITGGENQPTGTTKSFIALNAVKYFLLPSKTIITGTGISVDVTNSTGANANIMAVQLTTPYENWTADQINAMIDGYWEGLQGTREVGVKAIGKNIIKIAQTPLLIGSGGNPTYNYINDNSFYYKRNSGGNVDLVRFARIKVEPNQPYTLTVKSTGSNIGSVGLGISSGISDIRPLISGISSTNFTTIVSSPTNEMIFTVAGLTPNADITVNSIQIERGTVATPYKPYTETQLFAPLKLNRLPNGMDDEFTLDGKYIQRTAEKTSQTGVVNYADMTTGGSFIAQLADGTIQTGVKGATLTATATKIIYQLATPIETQYPSANLIAEPSGSIYVDSIYANAQYYDTGIVVSGRKFSSINKVTLIDKISGTEKDITSQCTLNANKDGFTATGVLPTDLIWYSLEFADAGILPTLSYSYPLNIAGAVTSSIEGIKQVDERVDTLETIIESQNYMYGDPVAEFENFDPINAQFLGGNAPGYYASQAGVDSAIGQIMNDWDFGLITSSPTSTDDFGSIT